MNFIISYGYSQTHGTNFTLPQVVQVAPEAASLGRYGDIPVSISTGVPDISIPLFTIHSGSLALPITINNHPSGIKVMDLSSCVGIGWALSAGGDIARVVQGQNDDNTNIVTGSDHNELEGFYYQIFPAQNDPSLSAKEKCLEANITDDYPDYGAYPADGQPDLFYYNIGKLSGKFILKNRLVKGITPGFMTIPYSPIDIQMPSLFKQFLITGTDGTKYFLGSNNTNDNVWDYSQNMSNAYTLPTILTAWHLTKIASANMKDSIVLKYTQGYSNVFNTTQNTLDEIFDFPVDAHSFHYSPNNITTTRYSDRLLTEIDFNNGKLTFDYTTNTGSSETGAILNAIHLYSYANNSYSEITRYTFYHSFFINTPGNTGRLRLDSLQETGYFNGTTATQMPYRFTYYGNNAPPFNVFMQDLWGYYNGQLDTSLLLVAPSAGTTSATAAPVSIAEKRMVNPTDLELGTLQSIQYPTGGVTNFEFEPNQITYSSTTYSTDTVYNSYSYNIAESIVSYTPSIQFTVPSDAGAPSVIPAVIDFQGDFITSSGNFVNNYSGINLDDITNSSSGIPVAVNLQLSAFNNLNPPTEAEITNNVSLQKGHTYKLYFINPVQKTSSETYKYVLNARIYWQTIQNIKQDTTTVTKTVLTGGLRIKSIKSSDGLGHFVTKEYKYPGVYFNSPLFDGNFDDLTNEFQFDSYDYLPTIPATQCKQQSDYRLRTRHYTGNLTIPLGSVSNNSVSYNEVEEYESDGNNSYVGKTVYDYPMVKDYVPIVMPFYKIDNEGQRELLLRTRSYKITGGTYKLIKDERNNYIDLNSVYAAQSDSVLFYTAHALVDNLETKVISDSSTTEYEPTHHPIGGTSYSCLGCSLFDRYMECLSSKNYYTSPKFVLQSSVVTNFDDAGDSLSITQSYDYQNPIHIYPTHIRRVTSNGENEDDSIKYVLDYSIPCTDNSITQLKQQLNTLIAAYNNSYQVQFSKYNQYSYINPNNAACPVLNTDSAQDAQTAYIQLLKNYDIATDVGSALINQYNANLSNYGNCKLTYYNSTSLSQKALVDLQSQNNIEPKIFIHVLKNGQSMLTTQTDYNTFSLNLTRPSVEWYSTRNNPLERRIQYLNYDSAGNVLMQQKTDDVKEVYLWGYNRQYPVAKIIGSDYGSVVAHIDTTILNRGTEVQIETQLSNLRAAFSGNPGIQVTTYTYTPLIGMTSETDPKGYTTFYEYDGFGRLKDAKDKDGNILKKYDYHYEGQ